MLTETFRSISTAVRKVLKNWQSMLLLAIVYAVLLAALYFFMAIREASITQVVLTFGLAIVAFVLFFLLHAMVIGGIAGESAQEDFGIAPLLKSSLSNLWKLAAISVPLIGLAILIAYLLNKAQNYFGVGGAPNDILEPISRSRSRNPAQPPINWRVAIFSSLRYLSFGLLPAPRGNSSLARGCSRRSLAGSSKNRYKPGASFRSAVSPYLHYWLFGIRAVAIFPAFQNDTLEQSVARVFSLRRTDGRGLFADAVWLGDHGMGPVNFFQTIAMRRRQSRRRRRHPLNQQKRLLNGRTQLSAWFPSPRVGSN